MARSRYNVVPQGQINIVRPQSGVDMLLETVSQYADPNYQLRRQQLASENRRADATLQLKRNEQKLQREALAKESQIADDEMKLKKAKGLREQTLHEQGIEDRIYKQAEDQFNVGYKSMVESGNFEDIGTYLGEYKTDNPRLNKKINSMLMAESGKNSALNSNVDIIEGFIPGITEKMGGKNALKSLMYKNPNEVASALFINEVGNVTDDNKEAFDKAIKIAQTKIKLASATLDPEEQSKIMSTVMDDLDRFREDTSINVDDLTRDVLDINVDTGEEIEPEYQSSGVASFLGDIMPTLGTFEKASAGLGFSSGKKAVDKRIYKNKIEPAIQSNDDKKILESLRNVYGKNSEGEIGFLNEKGSRLFRNTIPSDKQEEILSMLDSYYTNPKKWLTNYYADNPVK
jgi:hypothetical protein